ncbi:hypothetical protein DFH09DRAFT_71152 [Mycena vulgaris]|nr:hypothetical protein DFH09DRAFT_71152 [Mycena vulgaris]
MSMPTLTSMSMSRDYKRTTRARARARAGRGTAREYDSHSYSRLGGVLDLDCGDGIRFPSRVASVIRGQFALRVRGRAGDSIRLYPFCSPSRSRSRGEGSAWNRIRGRERIHDSCAWDAWEACQGEGERGRGLELGILRTTCTGCRATPSPSPLCAVVWTRARLALWNSGTSCTRRRATANVNVCGTALIDANSTNDKRLRPDPTETKCTGF